MKTIGSLALLLFVGLSIGAQEVPNLQKPLFTKMTATWCPNCGTWGWTYMKDVIAQNGNDMLIIGSHFSGDLETKAGDFFQSVFNTFGQPRFIFGNKDQGVRSNNLMAKLEETDAAVKQELTRQPEVGVGLNIRISNQSIDVHTKSKFFKTVDGEYYLSLYLIENNVVAEQASLGSAVQHPMVLRTAFTEAGEGVQIASGSIGQDFEMENDFSLIRQPNWNLDNSYIYALIWKKEGDDFIYQNGHGTEVMNTVISTEDENLLSAIEVYPTVSEGVFTVEFPRGVTRDLQVSIIDNNGRAVDQIIFEPKLGRNSLDLSSMPSGTYLLYTRIRGIQRSIP